MKRMGVVAVSLSWLICGAALASPLHFAGGQSIHVGVGGHRESALALRAEPRGWRLSLSAPAMDAVAEFSDLTSGYASTKWLVTVAGDAVLLDAARFVAGHAYRVQLHRGLTTLASGVVYLSPARGRATSSVVFQENEADRDGDDIAVTPKGAL